MNYLAYWRPKFDWQNPRNTLLDYAAGNQLGKVHPGDRVYIHTFHEGGFFLLGRITVAAVEDDRNEAARYLGREPAELFDATHYVLAAHGQGTPVNPVRFEEVLARLQVVPPGRPIRQPLKFQHFIAMRCITEGSAVLLDGLIAEHDGA